MFSPSLIRLAVLCLLSTSVAFAISPLDDPADPAIVAKAVALNKDPARIFAFVRDEIGLDFYLGAVRGARGTLLGGAGNNLDRASLLVALLGASNIQSRYVQGSLPYADAQKVVEQVTNPSLSAFGCPGNAPRSFPSSSFPSNNLFSQHFWVEYGAANTPIDPSSKTAVLGTVTGIAATRFTDVPDALRQKVTLRLMVETFSQASTLFGFGASSRPVLTKEFLTAELYGRPVSVGQFTTSKNLVGPAVTANTYTYSPYFLVGDPYTDIDKTTLINGSDYVENVTNFPLSSTFITGMFLEVDAIDNTSTKRTYTHTILDRIGPNARVTGGRINLSITGAQGPAVTDADITTVNVLAGRQSLGAFSQINSRLQTPQNLLTPLIPAITAAGQQTTPLTQAQLDIIRRAGSLARLIAIATNELTVASVAAATDQFLTQLETTIDSRTWYGTPRLVVSSTRVDGDKYTQSVNLLKRDLTWVGNLRQNARAGIIFEMLRGQMDSTIEGQVLAGISGKPTRSIDRVFAALASPNDYTFFGPANLAYLDQTSLSPAAKYRITAAANNNKVVITPTKMVTIDGVQTVGWLETDVSTGETVSTFEDGSHGALFEYVAGFLYGLNTQGANTAGIGKIHGIGASGITFSASVLSGIASSTQFANEVKNGKNAFSPFTESFAEKFRDTFDQVNNLLNGIVKLGDVNAPLLFSYLGALKEGFELGSVWFTRSIGIDPEIPTYITHTLLPRPAAIPPGSTPGVKITTTPDLLSFIRRGTEEIPTVFNVRVQNTGPLTDGFRLGLSQYPTGLNPSYGVDLVTIPAGQTFETSLCLSPYGKLPPPGSIVAFTPSVSNVTNTINAESPVQFSMPTFGAINLGLTPASIYLVPGQQIKVDLAINSVGNQALGAVDLTATPPAGVTLTGLSTPVASTAGQTTAQQLTVTLSASATLGQTVAIPITAAWGAAGQRKSIVASLLIGAATSGSKCAFSAAPKASGVNRNNLAGLLINLGNAMNELSANPSSVALQAKVVAALDALPQQLDVDPILAIKPGLKIARDTLEAATAAGVTAALNDAGVSICQLDAALDKFPSPTFDILPSPNSQVIYPNTPVNFTIYTSNRSNRPRTFTATVGALPAGVTATLTASQYTIEANTDTNNSNLFGFIVPRVAITATTVSGPFNFDVTVAPVDAPSTAKTVTYGATPRAEFVVVDTVVVTPGNSKPGDTIVFSARIFNAVNQTRPANIFYTVKNKAGVVYRGQSYAGQVTLTQAATIQTFTLDPPFATTNYPEGSYTIELSLLDPANSQVLNPVPAIGSFFIGPPISGKLSISPNVLPPTAGVTKARLDINRETAPTPQATLLGSIQTTSRAQSFVRNGNTAYVCGDKAVTIVDVTDPANLIVKGTFGQAQLGTTGYLGTPCTIANGHLFMGYTRENGNTTGNFLPTNISSYNLANPLAPTFVATKQINRQDVNSIQAQGTTGFSSTQGLFYNPFSRFIFQFHGQFFTLDLSNPADPKEAGALFPVTAGLDPRLGGPNPVYAVTAINPTTVLLAMSTTNQDPATGVGRVLIVDIANPAAPAIKATLDIPGTRLIYSAAVQGNTAILLGDTQGYYDAFSGLTGTLAITSLNISNLTAPAINQTVVTQIQDKDFATVIPIASGQFVAGGGTLGTQPLILLIDAQSPAALRYIPYTSAVTVYPQGSNGNFFYTLSSAGLSTYQLSFVNGPQLTARINVPKGTNVTPVAGSFSPAPTKTTTGTTFDTYEWAQPTVDFITFDLNVTALQPGKPRTVLTGGTLEFTLPTFGSGTFDLPAVTLVTDQILSITPATQTVVVLAPATYAVIVKNPTATQQVFNLTVNGLPANWAAPISPVTVPANGQTQVNLVITADAQAAYFGNYQFAVTAKTAAGIEGAAYANLAMNGGFYTGADSRAFIRRLVASMNPTTVVVGRGTAAYVTFTVENVGNTTEEAAFSFNLPGGFSSVCSTTANLSVAPSPGNRLTRECRLSAASFVAAGTQPFSGVVSTTYNTQIQLPGSIIVAPQGVTVDLVAHSTLPNTYNATITNTGTASDTFALTLADTLGPLATLANTSVTLAAGASIVVQVTLNNTSSLSPGPYILTVVATSQANSAVLNKGSISVTVSTNANTLVAVDPSPATVASAPGTANLVLAINNTGNITQSYDVSILGVTGQLNATLIDGNLQPTQTIGTVTIPSFGLGQINATATLTAGTTGTVTFRVKPVNPVAPEILVTATVQTGPVAPPPVTPPPVTPPPVTPPPVTPPPTATNVAPIANAGADREIPARQRVTLDGSLSSDPDNGPQPLTYAWTLITKPSHSSLTQQQIVNPTAVRASFVADVFGAFTFRLTVSDGKDTAFKDVTLHAANQPPVADPVRTLSANPNKAVFLDGWRSFDPDNDRITYLWTVRSVPAGSTVSGVNPNWSPRPYVIPDKEGVYVFRLVVRDQALEGAPVDVQLHVTAGSLIPVIDAGPALRQARPGAAITIKPASKPVSTQWSATATGGTLQLIDAKTGEIRFTPAAAGTSTIRFTAGNGTATGTADIAITAIAPPDNLAPYGNGNLGSGQPKDTVPLDATVTDPDNSPQALQYLWSFNYLPPGSRAALMDSTTLTAKLIPDASGVYVARLTANDGDQATGINTFRIVAQACDANADGLLNSADLDLIRASQGDTLAGALDPRDANRDGKIDNADLNQCGAPLPPAEVVQPPYIGAEPKLLEWSWQRGTPLPGPKTIFLEGDAVEYSVVSNGRGFIGISPINGSLPVQDKITVTLLPSANQLPAGRYDDLITVRSPRTGNSIVIRATLTVVDTPQLLVDQRPLTFRYSKGGALPPAQVVYVTATSRPVQFAADSVSAAWLQVTPNGSQTPANLRVSVNPQTLVPGAYSATVRVSSPDAANSPKDVPVTLIVE